MLPLTDHARFEMERRGITETEVEAVLHHPSQKIKQAGNREIWQNKVEAGEKVYVIRLVVEPEPVLKVVTVYKSSKLKKYWEDA